MTVYRFFYAETYVVLFNQTTQDSFTFERGQNLKQRVLFIKPTLH